MASNQSQETTKASFYLLSQFQLSELLVPSHIKLILNNIFLPIWKSWRPRSFGQRPTSTTIFFSLLSFSLASSWGPVSFISQPFYIELGAGSSFLIWPFFFFLLPNFLKINVNLIFAWFHQMYSPIPIVLVLTFSWA